MNPDRLHQLLDDRLDGRLADKGRQELEGMLRSSEAARDLFWRHAQSHVLLTRLYARQAGQKMLLNMVAEAPEPGPPPLRRMSPLMLSAVAASIILGVALTFAILLTYAWDRHERLTQPTQYFATLIDVRDAVFEASDVPTSPGSHLPGGYLRLKSGFAEIEFFSGAVVNVQGPCELGINSAMRAHLNRGEAMVRVPAQAKGFTVAAPGVAIVDLGTAFAVRAAPDEATQVHVFEGAVEVYPDSGGEVMPLRAGEAVELDIDSEARFKRIALRERIAGVSPRMPEPRVPDRLPAMEQVAVWLRADHGMEIADGRVKAWRSFHDDEIQAVQGQASVRPMWLPRGLNGRPAAMFSGAESLVLPASGELGIAGSDYEVFIVGRGGHGVPQFFLGTMSEAEQFELHLNGAAGVRFIPRAKTSGEPLPYADLGTSDSFAMHPHVFHARVENGVGIVGADGVESPDVVANARSMISRPLVLGIRGNSDYGLVGEIGEVIIYRGALTSELRREVLSHLGSKYQLIVRN